MKKYPNPVAALGGVVDPLTDGNPVVELNVVIVQAATWATTAIQ